MAALKRKTKSARTKSKDEVPKLKKQLWALCRQIIRVTYANANGTWNCYTCGRLIDEPAKAQTGHFIPSSTCGAFLRYDLRNLRIQDYYCNINLGGNGAAFYKNMVEEEGQAYVDELFQDKRRSIKADKHWFAEQIGIYTRILQIVSE